ncbi:MAG TPA: site-specific recombinase [Burkholderiaceae bacterium]|nr:site-specific recombinase [Burkholderiaceae bacterium]
MPDKRIALEVVLDRFVHDVEDSVMLFRALVEELRPRDPTDGKAASEHLALLTQLLSESEPRRRAVRKHLLELFANRQPLRLFTDAGILPASGFFSELLRRATQRFLPALLDPGQIADCLALVYYKRNDHLWLFEVSPVVRRRFWQTVYLARETDSDAHHRLEDAMLEAMRVLAVRVAAMGTQPELQRVMPGLDRFESPFLALAAEVERFVDAIRAPDRRSPDTASPNDARQLMVFVEQCGEVLKRARGVSARQGTSLALTYLLVRASQCLRRLQMLARARTVHLHRDLEPALLEAWVEFLSEAVRGIVRRNSVREHFHELIGLLALRITDNASRTGEHYITTDRLQYARMWRSAAGAGLIIGAMALIKILLSPLPLAPLQQAFVISMNYSLGFVLVYVLHCTIATKQPAMTAATIAGSIGQAHGQLRHLSSVVDMIAQIFRSQLAAILGNVLVALPTAVALGLGLSWAVGEPFVAPPKAAQLLHDLDPVRSLAIPHAAIAGVYLFLSGLIAGYYDNAAAYRQISQRVAALPRLRQLIGAARTERLAGYVDRNLGGLMSNFFFGIFLGSTATLGGFIGLPLDIRHITFAAANLGYALVAFGFDVPAATVAWSVLGVVLVGFTNLTVSFSLALWVALRSRGVEFAHWRQLLAQLGQRFVTRPQEFLLPPARQGQAAASDGPDEGAK